MDNDIRIVALQRGWVAVGHYSIRGERVLLERAAVVRRWGTDRGLGQLAVEGPRPNTVLDPSPPIEFHVLTELFSIRCNPENWSAHLVE